MFPKRLFFVFLLITQVGYLKGITTDTRARLVPVPVPYSVQIPQEEEREFLIVQDDDIRNFDRTAGSSRVPFPFLLREYNIY